MNNYTRFKDLFRYGEMIESNLFLTYIQKSTRLYEIFSYLYRDIMLPGNDESADVQIVIHEHKTG